MKIIQTDIRFFMIDVTISTWILHYIVILTGFYGDHSTTIGTGQCKIFLLPSSHHLHCEPLQLHIERNFLLTLPVLLTSYYVLLHYISVSFCLKLKYLCKHPRLPSRVYGTNIVTWTLELNLLKCNNSSNDNRSSIQVQLLFFLYYLPLLQSVAAVTAHSSQVHGMSQ